MDPNSIESASGPVQVGWQKICQPESVRMPKDMPDRMPERKSEVMPNRMPDMAERMSKTCQPESSNARRFVSSCEVSEDQKGCQKICGESECQLDMLDRLPERMSDPKNAAGYAKD